MVKGSTRNVIMLPAVMDLRFFLCFFLWDAGSDSQMAGRQYTVTATSRRGDFYGFARKRAPALG